MNHVTRQDIFYPLMRRKAYNKIYVSKISTFIIFRIRRLEKGSAVPDEAAHYEPPQVDLRCLPIQLFFMYGVLSVKLQLFKRMAYGFY